MFNHEPDGYVCPLCQMVRGEPTDRGDQSADILLRTDTVLALLASKWRRSNPGHVVVIPVQHFENLYDLPEEVGHEIFDFSKRIAIAIRKTYDCDGTSTRQHNEPAGNQDVWHYHLHVFPRYKDDNLYQRHGDVYWPSAEEKRPYAEKFRAYFQGSSP